jgi:hypothetical protein
LRLALPLIGCDWRRGMPSSRDGAEGIFYGRGLVKTVEPGTERVTLADDVWAALPATE